MASTPVGLVGSGEFTPATEAVDLELLKGRPQRVVFLPTAAAPEGETTLRYWTDLGTTHYRRLGIPAQPLMVRTREDAFSAALAAEIEGAGLIYLSGGDPAYLAATVTGTAVGDAIREAWTKGTAVAGCSAGAVALMERVPDVRAAGRPFVEGLGLVTGMMLLPHFDQLEKWVPGVTEWALQALPAGTELLGVEEDTALVGGPREWRVLGRQRAWKLSRDGAHRSFAAGEVLDLGAGSAANRPA